MALERSLARMHTTVEIAVDTIAGVCAAKKAQASSVELASALFEAGGLTPSLALVEEAVKTGIDVHVMIRPRPGGFYYTEDELDIMRKDIVHACKAGAKGVVFGIADETGTGLDVERMRELTNLAADNGAKAVTLHRLFDVLPDRNRALLQVAGVGVTRVLTSGGKDTAVDAQAELGGLVTIADTMGVEIVAGGGITPENVHELRDVRLHGIHASCKMLSTTTGPAGPGGGSAPHYVTDPAAVKKLVDIISPWTR
ncbi:MAG: copper homeostasis protein CutC [Corynebacterium sp.]|nr:copper homeostasis protein CutC [Corynebacterium sp.]